MSQKIKFLTGLYLQDIDRNTFVPWLDKDADKFRVDKNFEVWFEGDTIVVEAGYITDLSSVPKLFWFWYPPASSYGRKPSVIHDYIYSRLYHEYSKSYADRLFYEGLKAMGMPNWKAYIAYCGVRWFGKGGWDNASY